ncbi:MAG: hypothetical protein ACI9G1_004723, partial [Pirellulaceae bacterium]
GRDKSERLDERKVFAQHRFNSSFRSLDWFCNLRR